MRRPDPARPLLRALELAANAGSVTIAFEPFDSHPWAMGLFAGTRHRITAVAMPGPALDVFLAALPEVDLPIRGGCVADVAVVSTGRENGWQRLTISALVIEE